MSKPSSRAVIVAALFVTTITLLVGLSPAAQPQIQVAPAYVPIGAAASGTTSMVWFHQPASNSVLACQASSGAAGISGIQCVTAKLP